MSMVGIERCSIDSSLEDSVRDLGTLAHLSIIEGDTSKIRDDSLRAILLKILINSGVDKGGNGRLGSGDNLGKHGTLQERNQNVGN